MSKLVSRHMDILGVPMEVLKLDPQKIALSPIYKGRFLKWEKDEGVEQETEKFSSYVENVLFDSAFNEMGGMEFSVDGDKMPLDCLVGDGVRYIGLTVPSQWYDKPSVYHTEEDAKKAIAHALSLYSSISESDIEKMCQRRQSSWTELW